MRHFQAGFALVLTLSCFGRVAAQVSGQKHPVKQTFVEPDYRPDPFEKAVPLPADALQALLATKEARDSFSDPPKPVPKDPVTLFRAVKVDLSNTKEMDYLVKGQFPLTGGDCEWFWIVRVIGRRSRVVLFTNSNSVELIQHRTNGFRDIRSEWNSPNYMDTRIYRFDGTRYRLRYEKWKPVHP